MLGVLFAFVALFILAGVIYFTVLARANAKHRRRYLGRLSRVGVLLLGLTVSLHVVRSFSQGFTNYVNVIVLPEGAGGQQMRWTLRGDRGLDPGAYSGTMDGDTIKLEARDMKGKLHKEKYTVVSHVWLSPIR